MDLVAANSRVLECKAGKLNELLLQNREISELKPHLLFPHLTKLDLSNNKLTALPADIKKLEKLCILIADNNNLQSLPDEIGTLAKLRVLSVRNNEIKTLPGSLSLCLGLEELYVSSNKIVESPVRLGSLVKLTKLDVADNPFLVRLPKEVQSDPLPYFRNLQLSGEAKKRYRMKLMFVGNGDVGKTSLLRSLKQKKKNAARSFLEGAIGVVSNQSSSSSIANSGSTPEMVSGKPQATDGIDISEWSVKDKEIIPNNERLHFSAWDFAGQEVYYATHQFFLSRRSLYVIVFNLKKPEEENCLIEYWLQGLKARTGDSPIVLVGTRTDECTKEEVENTFNSILKRIRHKKRFHNLVYHIDVSTTTGTNISKLRKKLIEITMQQPHMTEEAIPANFGTLEEKIIALKNTNPMPPIINREAYLKILEACKLTTEDDITQATQFLYSMGVIVYFNDQKSGLDQMVILDSQWLTQVFSTIVSMKNQYAKDGKMKPSALVHMWKPPKYPESLHPMLLKILEKFEISYKLDSAGTLLIPWMLPDKQPDDFRTYWNDAGIETQLARYYQFEFLPVGLFSKLMVRLLNSSQFEPQCYWRSGIVFKSPGVRVFLTVDSDSSRLKLFIRGPQQVVKLIELDEAINTLVNDWLMVKVKVKVPCSHCVQEGDEKTAHLFEFAELEELVQNQSQFAMCPSGDKQIPIASLVPDITMSAFNKERIVYKELELGRTLGEGAYATVYEGVWRGEKVAIKKIKLDAMDGSSGANVFSEFRREAWLMSSLQNENLVVLKGICMEPFCLVLEFMNHGSLYDYLHDEKRVVDWKFRIHIASDIARAMQFLHQTVPPIVHRDLKSPNILLTCPEFPDPNEEGFVIDGRVVKGKVADFGLSRSLTFTGELDSKKLVGQNPVWLAPEIMLRKDYNEAVDIYSFGVILWEMMSREDYFGEMNFMSDIEAAVVSGKRPAIPKLQENDPNNVSVEYVELLQACWDNDPTKRPTFQEVARKLEALKRKMVRPNPNNIPQRFAAKSVSNTQRPQMRILQTRESVSVTQGRTESGVQALLQKFQNTPSAK
eukprot:TRINITY_DN2538_c0_g2_i1.p1 TRINITY_DN2538_c0_g2~~TRINITY_DN2538_c0_g2_i1.p1  ORF type:complete len:1060 (+),score=232.58 TRINITY_DN2538_c0_g2_i1:295-3474(+)